MRNIILLTAVWFPFVLNAADDRAVALLDKAVAVIKADMPLDICFDYFVYDDAGKQTLSDEGRLFMADGKRYSMIMNPVSVWCDGEKQWNYMSQTNEIYVTSANGDEAQEFSPLYLMQLYKKGYVGRASENDGKFVIILESSDSVDTVDFDKITVTLNAKNMRMESLEMQHAFGHTIIKVKDYRSKCTHSEDLFRCPVNEYPGAEVIDLVN